MIKYAGGKSREIEVIKRFIPEYKGKYIEPFLGGGALYFYLEPEKSIINDVNSKLIEFYLGIRNEFPQIKKELTSIENQYVSNRMDFEKRKGKADIKVEDANEKLYYQMRDFFNNNSKSNFHPATVYFFINKTAYSGMIRYNREGKYNVPYGRYKNFNTELVSKNHSELLKRSEIYCQDYKKIFDMSDKDDFIFLDPPYDCVFSG